MVSVLREQNHIMGSQKGGLHTTYISIFPIVYMLAAKFVFSFSLPNVLSLFGINQQSPWNVRKREHKLGKLGNRYSNFMTLSNA